jgi:hypothetical protein
MSQLALFGQSKHIGILYILNVKDDCYKEDKPEKRCYSEYNITDTTKIKKTWEEIKKINKEKTRLGLN